MTNQREAELGEAKSRKAGTKVKNQTDKFYLEITKTYTNCNLTCFQPVIIWTTVKKPMGKMELPYWRMGWRMSLRCTYRVRRIK